MAGGEEEAARLTLRCGRSVLPTMLILTTFVTLGKKSANEGRHS